jgi:hypothetical protein
MTRSRLIVSAVAALLVATSVCALVDRPYHDGSVWDIQFIRMKPGMGEAYMQYLANDWKKMQESLKKEGMILSYKVIGTEAHSPTDWNLMLMTEYKDMATMEANQQKEEDLAQRVIGDDQKQQQGYEDRSKIREIIADRLAREIVLEPRAR